MKLIFKNPVDIFFIFQIKVLSKIVFTRLPSFKIFNQLRLTLEKEANRWKIGKKWLSLPFFVAIALQH